MDQVFNLVEYYTDIDVRNSRYNANSIGNKGNFFFIKSDFTRAKEIYL